MEGLVPLLTAIIKSFPARILDIPVGLAAIFKHTYEPILFFTFPPLWYFPIVLLALICPQYSVESLVPLFGVIIKSCQAGIMDVPVALAAILTHTY